MLFDLFTSLTTPCSPYIRHMDYLSEAVAMRNRFRGRRHAWQQHLDATRRFVLSSAQNCRNRNKLVILGSGVLLDVPLHELSVLFREVVLVDVVCLPEVRKQIKSFSNVTFVEHDVTRVAERLYLNKQSGIHLLPEAMPALPQICESADIVVSLNILSQLWVIPRAYAIKPLPKISEEQLNERCRKIVEAHYVSLLSLRCRVCLIADYEYVMRDREDKIISTGSTVYGLRLPKPDDSWTWNIQPIQKKSEFHSKQLIVGAWHLNQ